MLNRMKKIFNYMQNSVVSRTYLCYESSNNKRILKGGGGVFQGEPICFAKYDYNWRIIV